MRHLTGQKGARKALGGIEKGEHSFTPRYIGEFSRRASRVGNLPPDEKKVVYPTVVLRFFQQKSNLGLDTRHEAFILIRTLLRARGGCFI